MHTFEGQNGVHSLHVSNSLKHEGISPTTAGSSSGRTLEHMLRSILPAGISITDADNLECSFASEYVGPPIGHPVPRVEPLKKPKSLASVSGIEISFSSRSKPEPLNLDIRNAGTSASQSPDVGLVSSPITGLIEKGPSSLSCSRSPLSRESQEMIILPGVLESQSSPDSDKSGNSVASKRLSGINSFSHKSSSSEIEEVVIPFPLHPISSPKELDEGFGHLQRSETSPARESVLSKPQMNGAISDHFPEDCKNMNSQARKKGECHGCFKGHRLKEKEICLVCNAKYCKNCVLTAMGSMPEGRKCLKCIGQPINESCRPCLGRSPRILKRLLSPLEVQQIMKTEKLCPANQLRPEQLIVNERALTTEEMADLLGCSVPPTKLKPGKYWYDKLSGLWGKEGGKPDKIITAELKVGGDLRSDASAGATEVYINGREITKSELKILKFAGVQCQPKTYLFLYPDGRYTEEGQNNVKGNIWGKASTRLLSPFLSLPTPRGTNRIIRPDLHGHSRRYLPGYLDQKRINKLLLLGFEGCGRSTIFKQAKILYKDGFNQEELQKYKELIQRSLYKYLVILLEGREQFEEEEEERWHSSPAKLFSFAKGSPIADDADIPDKSQPLKRNIYSLDTRLKHLADWFLDITADGSIENFFPAATREYASSVEELWHDPAIQATYKRKNELHMLPAVAGNFLERVVEISSNEYEPFEHDVLCAEGLIQGSGLAEIEFSLEDREPVSGTLNDTSEYLASVGRYQLIKTGCMGLTEGKKWLGMFEDVRMLIFCVAISEFDQLWIDQNGMPHNKMTLARELFESIAKHPSFRDVPFVLLFNKYDKFEEKIQKGIPLTSCQWFSDYTPVGVQDASCSQQAYMYIVHKFKKLFGDRKVYTYALNAHDRNAVSSGLQYIKEVLKWEDNKAGGWGLLPEDSSYCTDMSSYSLHSAVRHEHRNSWDRNGRYA